MQIHLNPRIVADSDILAGQPVIKGTQVPVSELVAAVAEGSSPEEVARKHGIAPEDVQAALAYAAQRAGESMTTPGERTTRTKMPPVSPPEPESVGNDPATLSPPGRQLIELRKQVIASGIPLISSWEELDREIAEIRGERYTDTDA